MTRSDEICTVAFLGILAGVVLAFILIGMVKENNAPHRQLLHRDIYIASISASLERIANAVDSGKSTVLYKEFDVPKMVEVPKIYRKPPKGEKE